MTFRQSSKELAGDDWNLRELAGISAEKLWNWYKKDTTGYDGHEYLTWDKCIEFNRELWCELGECMWRKHQNVYQDHMKYICNDIVNTLKVKILYYAERVREMHELAKYLPPPSMKGEIYEAANYTVRNQEFTDSEVQLIIKDRPP